MRESGPYVAICALLITLGGALYGWATTQGQMQADMGHMKDKVGTLEATVNKLSTDFNGTRLEITRWMAAHEGQDRTRRRIDE